MSYFWERKAPLLMNELTKTLRLSWPFIASLFAEIGMTLTDTMMLGHLNKAALAAGGLGGTLYNLIVYMFLGIISTLGVLIAGAYGRSETKRIKVIMIHGGYLAVGLGILLSLTCLYIPYVMRLTGQPPLLTANVQRYLIGIIWGALPLMLFSVLREYCNALSRTNVVFIILLIAIPLNVFLNYGFIYGYMHFPRYGLMGAGLATAITNLLMCFSILSYVVINKHLNKILVNNVRWLDVGLLKEILHVGGPIAMSNGLEIGLFSVASFFVGFFSTNALAAHQIALQIMTIAILAPLGISQATAIRVSQAVGQRQYQVAKMATYTGVGLGWLNAIIFATIVLSFGPQLIHFFMPPNVKENYAVIHAALIFLYIAVCFQVMDSTQSILAGALRGLKDTKVPVILAIVSYWLCGLIPGLILAFFTRLQVRGIWLGFGIGMTVAAILMMWRQCKLWKKIQKEY